MADSMDEPVKYQIAARIYAEISSHYALARDSGCTQIVWSSEGLYLLRNKSEIRRLHALFDQYSSSIEVVMCVRRFKSFRKSWRAQLRSMHIETSSDKDSYRYIGKDSWIFDRGERISAYMLIFKRMILFSYSKKDNIREFLLAAGLPLDLAPTSLVRDNQTSVYT